MKSPNDSSRRLSLFANIQVVVGLASTLIGLLLVFAPATSLFDAYNSTIARAFWNIDALTIEASQMNHWLLATIGAGVIGWGIAWTLIAHIPYRAGEKWAWICLSCSLFVWSRFDIGIALWFGVWGEVLFIAAAFTAAAIPLLISRSLFWTIQDE